MSRIANVLTIAGVDPSGGAGVFADLKAFSALGAYGCGVVAALTAQNTRAVTGVHTPPVDFLRLQIDTLFADVRIDAVKIGMLASAEIVAAVADRLGHFGARNLVVDPVMVAKSGDHLLAQSAVAMLREALLPLALVVTPNLPEAGVLLGRSAPDGVRDMYRAAEAMRGLLPSSGEHWVLLKGGHLSGDVVLDLLHDGDRMIELKGPRVATRNTHGTGCTLSAAIAALLPQRAADPCPVEAAVRGAREYLFGALRAADRLEVGTGHGPVHHFHALWQRESGAS
jgi:hydroxymethylpyrimidine/phosphomethylpyrimidine kinase